ncbi:MAG: ABC transporter substrate-binding protein [Firmicutes bacterium]|nr:ABC transporter substrate-binding protein [Bacillota bacterium]
MSRKLLFGFVVAVLCFSLALIASAKTYRIGVTQIVEHPALDAAVDGFQKALADAGIEVVYDRQNAQGDMSTALMIAQKFVNDRVDLILAVATPTAQAAANVTKDIPILITAVTDPVSAGLVKSIERSGTNVAGTSDLNPVGEQLALFKEIDARIKRIGVVYNAGETNSVVQVKLAQREAAKLGLKLVEAAVSNSSEVYQAALSLVGRVDGIYVPTDNTVVSALESVVKVAAENDLPVIAGEENSVARGCLATVGIDYYRLGYQTGEIAVDVLTGRAKPQDMAIQYQKDMKLVINLKAAEEQNVKLPQSLLDRADEILK